MNYLLIQKLGISNSGVIFICINLVVISTTFTQLGFNESIVRFISQFNSQGRYHSIRNLMKLVQKYTVIFSFSLTILLIISSGFLNNIFFPGSNFEFLLIVFCLSIPFIAFTNINSYFFRGMGFSTISLVYLILLLPLSASILIIIFDINNPIHFCFLYSLSAFIVFLTSTINKKRVENKFDYSKNSIFKKKIFIDFL